MRAVRWGTSYLRRQYLVATAVFALLLVGIFALFAQLLIGQLSRNYLEDVLLSGRAHAEEVARQVEGKGPTYKVLEQRREELYKLSDALSRQDIIDRVKFFDERGKLAFEIVLPSEGYLGTFPEGHNELVVPSKPDAVKETSKDYEVTLPLSDYRSVVVALSKNALANRIALLRHQLFMHTAAAAGLSALVLAAALGFIWHLLQRNAALQERRQRDEQLAVLGSLAANLAHEIRNPLNALSLNLELLDEELDGRGSEVETVGFARREAGRLSRLVNDFLVYARPAPPQVDECRVQDLLRDVSTLLAPTCARAQVTLRTEGENFEVRIDRGQMSQALVNLAFNAIHAMESMDVRVLTLGARQDGDSVILEVADTGPGIREEDLPRVREAFFSRRKGGTGLGLAIVDRIVNDHGGRLDLVNGPSGGLRARVALPLGPGRAEASGRTT